MTTSGSIPKLKVAILDDYQDVALSITGKWAKTTLSDGSSLLSRLSIDSFRETLHDENALGDRLSPYDIICAMRERTKFPASLLDRLPDLKLIATTGTYNLGIDVVHAKSKGIVVSGTDFGAAYTTTHEHIWALIFSAARHIVQEDRNIKACNPRWQSVVPTGLSGKTLGLIGLGKLGSPVAEIARAFGMRVLAWSPNLTAARASRVPGVTYSPSKTHLLSNSDIISVHLVLSPATYHIISMDDLALLKPTAYLINTSRGPLVDETALIKVLKENKIAGAALDTFDIEPLPLDHPFRELGDKVTLSPHNAYVSHESWKMFWDQTVENIAAFLEGKPGRPLAAGVTPFI
ncbi:D-3-phosphoglycerate dehydrogenase [Leucoagaricus sp. SymC.cos]|nr:D-3-phosphoglycerate dehydrogenase [Leucoagaricus sp. SymC.cos]